MATALLLSPVAIAIASMVSVDDIVMAPVYGVELAVGAVPLVV